MSEIDTTVPWVLETERLLFRPFTFEDLPQLIEQRSDPDVNRYLGGKRLQNPEFLSKRIHFYIECFAKFGFGSCVMIWKETGAFIGSAGLQPLEDTGEIEVGYSLMKKYWGQGIATEAARAWMDFGFREKGLDRIVAVAVVENKASQRIMKKLGMRYEKSEEHWGEICNFYGVSKEEFLGAKYEESLAFICCYFVFSDDFRSPGTGEQMGDVRRQQDPLLRHRQ
jgi:[ribosomal protein S5]-alanine N-acetyltransferase